ncbi:DUF4097 family beta strand repeat-containing protein [Acanthopleuribacter pedis]|uniref:DUF4097 family beta strand repeat protein n=1 Tax=Acanthopleuribacter pedis TaxID=442870 RepID=A0A8J7Q4Y3_9BACT|nr:DUF4097 family beta strand repeat-containing protein [Acanthopleuribacter pedis]MBO1317941.1 DUF4097 family beta strand repeat protein [Acanthopleuribacter pedis]
MKWLVSLCLLTASLTVIAAERVFEERFPAGENGLLKVRLDRGDIDVISGGDEYVVKLVVSGHEEPVNDFEVTFEESGEGLNILGKGARNSSGWSFFNWSFGKHVRVHLHVTVPRTTHLDLGTSGGDISASGTEASASVKTSGGNITLSDLKERVHVKTSGGNIRLSNSSDKHELRTSGGDIDIVNAAGDFTAKTSGGDIDFKNVRGPIVCATSGGSIDIELTQDFGGIRASTSGGDIRLRAPANIAANLKAGTSGGSVRMDLPLQVQGKIKSNRIQGTLNGGGESIHLSTSGGDIRVSEL